MPWRRQTSEADISFQSRWRQATGGRAWAQHCYAPQSTGSSGEGPAWFILRWGRETDQRSHSMSEWDSRNPRRSNATTRMVKMHWSWQDRLNRRGPLGRVVIGALSFLLVDIRGKLLQGDLRNDCEARQLRHKPSRVRQGCRSHLRGVPKRDWMLNVVSKIAAS